MLRPPESVENKNDHDLPFNIAGLMQSLAERGAKRLRPTHRCGSHSQVPRVASTWLRSGAVSGSSEAAPGGRWTGGMLPPGTRTVSEREKSSYAAHLMGRLALKLSSSSVAPCKFLIPTFGVCVEPHKGAPRQTVGLLR
jgi:hypothetical protein